MERRVTSHTEEEEMNQRRRLLTQARKGDQKSIDLLFELYQVKVFSGEALKKKKLPSFPVPKPANGSGKGGAKGKEKAGKLSRAESKGKKGEAKASKLTTQGTGKPKTLPKASRAAASKKSTKQSPATKKSTTSKADASKKKAVSQKTQVKKVVAAKKSRIAKKK